jgi:hypothetical protein
MKDKHNLPTYRRVVAPAKHAMCIFYLYHKDIKFILQKFYVST